MKRAFFLLAFAFAALAAQPAGALLDSKPDATWTTDGDVYAIARSGDTVYVGGSFDFVGPQTGGWGVLDEATGTVDLEMPPTDDNDVYAVASDGAGGWYIGGGFNTVGGLPRQHLAHILADKTVDPNFNPGVNGFVEAIAASADTVYVGGQFDAVGGVSRAHLAALRVSDGAVKSWQADVGGSGSDVYTLALSSSTLYVGGTFTTIDGESLSNLAAVDASTGAVDTDWAPNPGGTSNQIFALALGDTSLYVGGSFSEIGGEARANLAEVAVADGVPTTWAPEPNATVRDLALAGDDVYAVGDFTSIGSASRNFAARIDATGAATAWDPDPDGLAFSVAVATADSGTVWVGGGFTTIGGANRSNLAAIEPVSGVAEDIETNADASVTSLAVSGFTVAAAGNFRSIGGASRSNIAAFDATTGAATDWDPGADSRVSALAVSGDTVYTGGEFTSIGGVTRNRIAAIDSNGDATSWDPDANGDVMALVVGGDGTVYAGGGFSAIGGQARSNLAALDADGLAIADWDPVANNPVLALAHSDGILYAGGEFTTLGPTARPYLAALDSDGNPTAWNPSPDGPVRALLASGNLLYAGGNFTSLGTASRPNLAAIRTASGLPTAWRPVVDGDVYALALLGGSIHLGGSFGSVGGKSRENLAAVSASTGVATAWDPQPDDNVRALFAGGGKLYAGGEFDELGEVAQNSFAAFSQLPDLRVSDVRVTEGNSGTKTVRFRVSLSKAWDEAVSVRFKTKNGTARAPSDYRYAGGTLVFAPGQTVKRVAVKVKGDLRDERNETFFLLLSNASNAGFADAKGRALIVDND